MPFGVLEDVEPFSSEHFDTFSRLRVSIPVSSFESDFWNDARPELFATATVTGGTVSHSVNLASMLLATNGTSGASGVLQSRMPIKARPGKSTRVAIAGNFKAAVTNVKKYIGQYSTNNGHYFLLDGSTLNVGTRSKVSGSVVDTLVAQSSWNLDKLDGTGPSGKTVDITKQQLFVIEYPGLGSCATRYGFSIDGKVIYCHVIYAGNTLTTPAIQSGTLPLRAEIVSSATSSASDFHVTCFSVLSEGGSASAMGHRETIATGTTLRTFNSTTAYPIIAIRKQSGSVEVPVGIDSFYPFNSSADDILWEVHMNPTALTGGSWASSGTHLEYNITATAMTVSGVPAYSFFVKGGSGSSSTLPIQNNQEYPEMIIGSDASGNSDVIVFAARSLTGSANVGGAVNIIAFE